jgi:hypothetical protein
MLKIKRPAKAVSSVRWEASVEGRGHGVVVEPTPQMGSLRRSVFDKALVSAAIDETKRPAKAVSSVRWEALVEVRGHDSIVEPTPQMGSLRRSVFNACPRDVRSPKRLVGAAIEKMKRSAEPVPSGLLKAPGKAVGFDHAAEPISQMGRLFSLVPPVPSGACRIWCSTIPVDTDRSWSTRVVAARGARGPISVQNPLIRFRFRSC